MKPLIHHVPADVANESLLGVSEINSTSFDFSKHFDKESLAKLGRFYICYKAKPWMVHDLMIIDSSNEYSRSVGTLSSDDLLLLGKIIKESIKVLDDEQEITKIIFGANINSLVGKEDHESILRLHVHVCGLTRGEIGKMENLDEDLPIFSDDIISKFKKIFGEQNGFEPYAYGIKKDLDHLEASKILEEIKIADGLVSDVLWQLAGDFSVVSYSFAVVIENNQAKLFISPKSSDGRGVLEAIGIVLSRDSELKADSGFVSERNSFLIKVKDRLMKNISAGEGKLNLEAR